MLRAVDAGRRRSQETRLEGLQILAFQPQGRELETACDQHFGDAIECIADLAQEFAFGAHAAAVSARELQVLVHTVVDYLFRFELQNFSRLIIMTGNGVPEVRVPTVTPCSTPVCAVRD